MIILQDAEGLDRTEGGGRPEDRRLLALAPGAVRRDGDKPGHVKLLEEWMKSYRPEELFDATGALKPEIAALAPAGRPADERQPARQWRAADARRSTCPISRTMPSRSTRRARTTPRRPR